MNYFILLFNNRHECAHQRVYELGSRRVSAALAQCVRVCVSARAMRT